MNLTNILFTEALKGRVLNKGSALSAAKYPTSTNFIHAGGVKRWVLLGVVNAVNSAITIKAQQATTEDGTPKDIEDAVIVLPADGSYNGKWFTIEFETSHMDSNNGYQYITFDVAGAAGADDLVTLLLFEIDGELAPVVQDDLATAVNVVG